MYCLILRFKYYERKRHMKKFKSILFITVFLMVCCGCLMQVKGENDTNLFAFSIIDTKESYVDISAKPGDIITFSVQLYNNGAKTKTNTLYISDSYTANNGGTMTLSPEEATRDGVGGWFQPDRTDITLEPGEKTVIEIIGRIPNDIESGTHIAVLYLRSQVFDGDNSDPNKKGASFKINHVYSLSSAIVIRLAGKDEHGFLIKNGYDKKWIKDKDLVLSFIISNIGNTYDYPKVVFEMYDNNDVLHYNTEQDLDIVYPNNLCNVIFAIPREKYINEKYKIRVTVKYNKNTSMTNKYFDLNLTSSEISTAEKEIKKEEEAIKTYLISENSLYILLAGAFVLIILIYFLFYRKHFIINEPSK